MSGGLNYQGISHYEAGNIAAEFMNGIHGSQRGRELTEAERLQLTLMYVQLVRSSKLQEAVELSELFGFGVKGAGSKDEP